MTGRLSRNTGPIVELAREWSVAIVIPASVRFHPRAHIHARTCVSARGELKKKMRRATRKEEDRQEDAKGKLRGRRERLARESARGNLTTVYRRWSWSVLFASAVLVALREASGTREPRASRSRPSTFPSRQVHVQATPTSTPGSGRDPAANAATGMTGCFHFQGRSR